MNPREWTETIQEIAELGKTAQKILDDQTGLYTEKTFKSVEGWEKSVKPRIEALRLAAYQCHPHIIRLNRTLKKFDSTIKKFIEEIEGAPKRLRVVRGGKRK